MVLSSSCSRRCLYKILFSKVCIGSFSSRAICFKIAWASVDMRIVQVEEVRKRLCSPAAYVKDINQGSPS